MTVVSYTSLNTTKSLVNTDMGSIVLSASTSGIVVKLPDATTLTSSQRTAILKNTGAYTLYVQDNAGNPLCNLDPGASATLFATAVGTAAGTWTSDTYVANGLINSNWIGFQWSLNYIDVEVQEGVIARIAEIWSVQNSATPGLQLIRDIDGVQTVIARYAPSSFAMDAANNDRLLGACKINPGQVVVFWRNNTNTIFCSAFTIDANYNFTESASSTNTGYTINSSAYIENYFGCCTPTAGRAQMWFSDSGNNLKGAYMTTAVSAANAITNVFSNINPGYTTQNGDIRPVVVGSGQVIVGFLNGSLTKFIGVSNTSVGTAVNGGYFHNQIWGDVAGSGQALFFASGGTANTGCGLYLVTLSGTTITITTSNFPSWSSGIYKQGNSIVGVDSTNTTYFVVYNAYGTPNAVKVTLSGTTITPGTPVQVGPACSTGAAYRAYKMSGGRRATIKLPLTTGSVGAILRESALT